MLIISSDEKRLVDVGGSDIWYSVYSTALDAFAGEQEKIASALEFMEEGECVASDGYETARQFNLIRDKFAGISPDRAVYDIQDKKRPAPWKGRLSPVITSCANLYTTADGRDLLYEVVSILTYAQIAGVDVQIEC